MTSLARTYDSDAGSLNMCGPRPHLWPGPAHRSHSRVLSITPVGVCVRVQHSPSLIAQQLLRSERYLEEYISSPSVALNCVNLVRHKFFVNISAGLSEPLMKNSSTLRCSTTSRT